MKKNMYSNWYNVGAKKYRLNLTRVYMNIFILVFAVTGLITMKDTMKVIRDYQMGLSIDTIAGQTEYTPAKTVVKETVEVTTLPISKVEEVTKVETSITNILQDTLSYDITSEERQYLANFKKYNKREFKEKWFISLKKYCNEYDVPIELMLSIYSGESNGNPNLRNKSSGALGLGQIMRGTYTDLRKIFKDGSTFEDMKNPYLNIKYTTFLVRLKLKQYKSPYKAFYSYGGCRKPVNKDKYRRYINKHVKNVIGNGVTITDILDRMI